ncbi:MAG: hypothetical protein QOG31_470 [Thermoplasmata archaeon]|jgi:hypothetical protein|nr:hypothetical protein [Thermoplasmata archaeon]
MRGALPALAAFLLAGCFSAAPGAPPVATGRIDGAVVDGFLNPYAFQNVTLVNLGLVDQTSKLGGFTFRDVPAGTYTLVAQRPGTDGDVKVVEVRPDHITRVILQMLPHRDPLPFVSTLKNTARTDLAMPGADCPDCAWGTFLLEQPKEMVLQAAWDAAPVGGNSLSLQLVTDDGTILGQASGESPLEIIVHENLPNQQRVKVLVHFADDFTPRPFQMASILALYYVQDRAHQAGP